jgi:predicted nuclease of predicted toxin-antitoxin system
MRFIIDAQLPFKLASFLRKIGHDAVHTSDLPNKNFSEDNEIIRYSIDNDAVVISKDVDF